MDLCLVNVKNDTMVLERLFPVFVQKEIKGLRKCAFPLRAQEIDFDTFNIGVLAPDNAQGFQQLSVNVIFGRKGLCQFSDGRRWYVDGSRGRLVEPGVCHDFRDLRRAMKEAKDIMSVVVVP